MAVVFLLHVARCAVGTPGLATMVVMGVPSSICHLPPARGVRGASHAMCLAILPLVIQTGGYLEPAVRMEEVQPGMRVWIRKTSVVGNWSFLALAGPKWKTKYLRWSKLEQATYKAPGNISDLYLKNTF